MSDLYARLIMLERDRNEMKRQLAELAAQMVEVRQNTRIAGMSQVMGSGLDSATGLGWATTNAAISSGASGNITLLTEALASTGTVVSALNGWSFTIPISTRVQYRKTSIGTYVIGPVNCTP